MLEESSSCQSLFFFFLNLNLYSAARTSPVLPEPDTLGGAGPGAGRKTLGLRIALFVEGRGMKMLIPIIDYS
jgi:hypothetical protein